MLVPARYMAIIATRPNGRAHRESSASFQSTKNMARKTKAGTARLASPSGRAWASSSSMESMSSMNIFFKAPTPFSWITPRGCRSSFPWREARRFFRVL